MINGHVVAHRVLVNVPLRTANQPEVEVAFVIDTGFTGFLTLPPAIVAALNLPFLRRILLAWQTAARFFCLFTSPPLSGTELHETWKSLRRAGSLCLARCYWMATN